MDKQSKLNFDENKEVDNVNEYKFDTMQKPIKGYPELHWAGKRPFRSTQYFPAQLKEEYGEATDGWMNKIFWGDNLQVMSHLLKDFRGKIDLIYIDPPFDSKADYKKKINLRGQSVTNDHMTFEEKQYSDIWNNDEYLQFMYERLILLRELLSDTGSIYIHIDYRKSHHLRCIMDEVFGFNNIKNELIWQYQGSWVEPKNKFPKRNQIILFYTKSSEYNFNVTYDEEYVEKGVFKRWSRFIKDGKIYGDNYPETDGKFNPYLKNFREENKREPLPEDIIVEFNGPQSGSVWYISTINPISPENKRYPTQKPEKLLERIIESSSNQGDIVFDCFMGSGTTQAVAMKLGRRFIGSDINLGAIQTTTKRLLNIKQELDNEAPLEKKYTGFEVYNVNNYDVFRNPVQAKEILIRALEIQPLPQNSLYDGEKDGRMVKIMPINRIATKADLKSLITAFDYKKFEKTEAQQPNQPVESLLLVCMGHEPNLAAELQKGVPYKLDIEVVDIHRDKAVLQFKRDSEAEVKIDKGKVVITQFYPLNLLNKLSLEKEKVTDWRELVDSIMVDFNYDGAVLNPTVIDVPTKNDFVTGEYEIPEGAGVIKIKITDLLSESFEMEVKNG